MQPSGVGPSPRASKQDSVIDAGAWPRRELSDITSGTRASIVHACAPEREELAGLLLLLGGEASALLSSGRPSPTSPQKTRWGSLWNSWQASLSEGSE